MTVRTPPTFLQAGSHPAEVVRLLTAAEIRAGMGASFTGGIAPSEPGHGVVDVAHLKVTATGTPDMQVHVSLGAAFIRGTQSAWQGVYGLVNDGQVDLTVPTAHGTNPTKHLVIAQVRDAAYSGADNDARILIVPGTPAASPADPSLAGYPNALVLARIDVPATDTTISSGQITDLRQVYGWEVVCTSTTRPPVPWKGQRIYETDTGKHLRYYGATTGWAPPWGEPWGKVTSASVTSNQTINTTAQTPITGASVTFTPPAANRRYRITAQARPLVNSVNPSAVQGFIVKDGTNFDLFAYNNGQVQGASIKYSGETEDTPTQASHTYRLDWQFTATGGTGNSNQASSIDTTRIYVEDVGPANPTAPTD